MENRLFFDDHPLPQALNHHFVQRSVFSSQLLHIFYIYIFVSLLLLSKAITSIFDPPPLWFYEIFVWKFLCEAQKNVLIQNGEKWRNMGKSWSKSTQIFIHTETATHPSGKVSTKSIPPPSWVINHNHTTEVNNLSYQHQIETLVMGTEWVWKPSNTIVNLCTSNITSSQLCKAFPMRRKTFNSSCDLTNHQQLQTFPVWELITSKVNKIFNSISIHILVWRFTNVTIKRSSQHQVNCSQTNRGRWVTVQVYCVW